MIGHAVTILRRHSGSRPTRSAKKGIPRKNTMIPMPSMNCCMLAAIASFFMIGHAFTIPTLRLAANEVGRDDRPRRLRRRGCGLRSQLVSRPPPTTEAAVIVDVLIEIADRLDEGPAIGAEHDDAVLVSMSVMPAVSSAGNARSTRSTGLARPASRKCRAGRPRSRCRVQGLRALIRVEVGAPLWNMSPASTTVQPGERFVCSCSGGCGVRRSVRHCSGAHFL